jgi:regulator of cell morphogenesis and NO signaling
MTRPTPHTTPGSFAIHPDETLGEIAARHPPSTAVFLRHRLDFCCGGRTKLVDACAALDLAPETVLAEIVEASRSEPTRSWKQRPLGELTAFLVRRYHDALRLDLPPLIEAARKVERVHAAKASCPQGLAALLERTTAELLLHMRKEEDVLFPAIEAGARGQAIHRPVRVLMEEHDEHGEHLRALRALANDFVAPAEACATWRALFRSLEKLEAELMEHIHLENNVLFPRALGA